jgi:hypothetical protein
MANAAPYVQKTIFNSFDFLQVPASSVKNMTVLKAALDAGACKVAFLGHSITEGNNQNWLSAAPWKIIGRQFARAFPSVTFNNCNFGLGGRTSDQYGTAANIIDTTGYVGKATETPSTGYFRNANTASFYNPSWTSDDGTRNGSTLNQSWRNAVRAFSPDLVIVNFDLNDTVLATFKTAIQFIIDDINTHADWSAKRPSIILMSSHTGLTTPSLIRQFHVCLRALAVANNVPLIDGGRVYDILTTGVDPETYSISGEAFFRYDGAYNSAASFVLNTAYWANVTGVGYSPTGTSLRDQSNGVLVALRKRACRNVKVTGIYSSFNASSVPSLFYRADPASLISTASRYIVKISGTTLSLIYQATGGGQTSIATATVGAITGSSSHHIQAEVIGARHIVRVNGIVKINVLDYSDFSEGYAGLGISGSTGNWLKGTNLTGGFSIEYYDPITISAAGFTDAQLLGSVNDFATNPDSMGGNAINHMTNVGYTQVYIPAIAPVIRQIQAVFA